MKLDAGYFHPSTFILRSIRLSKERIPDGKKVGVNTDIGERDAGVGNMKKTVVGGKNAAFNPIKLRASPRMQKKFKIRGDFTLVRFVTPISVGKSRPGHDIWDQFGFGLDKFVFRHKRGKSQNVTAGWMI